MTAERAAEIRTALEGAYDHIAETQLCLQQKIVKYALLLQGTPPPNRGTGDYIVDACKTYREHETAKQVIQQFLETLAIAFPS